MCKTARIWCCALSLQLLFVACGDGGSKPARDAGTADEGPSKDQPEPDQEEDAGGAPSDDKKRGSMRGRVTYADGTALGQVNVRVAGKVLKSDSRGVFTADDIEEGDQEIVIEDGRVTRAQLKVKIKADRQTQAELSVMPLKEVAVHDVSAGGEISDVTTGAFKIMLKGGSLRTKDKKEMAKGEAKARYAVAKESRDLRAAPGSLKGTMGAKEVQLESFGITELRFSQQEGEQEVELELSEPADVALPLAPNSFSDKQEVDAWVFDGDSGSWKQEGKATIDKSMGGNGVAKLAATRAAWWSVANEAKESSCISGRLLAADGMALANATIEAIGINYWGAFNAFTNEDGSFCLSVKPGQNTTLKAFGLSGSSYFEWKKDVYAGAAGALCGGTGCTDAGTIMGESLFDECSGDVTHDQNHALLLSSGDATLDMSLKSSLEQLGHTTTLGVSYDLFDGKIDLGPYDAIYLQANYNWSGRDMPIAGQRQLINWVNCGGGLVTTEWTTWKIGSNQFQLIDAIFPAVRTTAYGSPSPVTYARTTPETTINRGLSDSLTFMTTSYGGTESFFMPRAGAVIYYSSMSGTGAPPENPYSGLIGWPYNLGRVASFSTTIGTAQVADMNFMRLVANTIDWAQKD